MYKSDAQKLPRWFSDTIYEHGTSIKEDVEMIRWCIFRSWHFSPHHDYGLPFDSGKADTSRLPRYNRHIFTLSFPYSDWNMHHAAAEPTKCVKKTGLNVALVRRRRTIPAFVKLRRSCIEQQGHLPKIGQSYWR